MTTGQRIGELAKKKEINLHQLAQMANISYNTLYSIVRRKSDKVNYDTLQKIATALEVSPLELVTGMNEEEWRNEFEEEWREYEAKNRARLLAIFAINHPLFMEALNSLGITISINETEMSADWEDVSVDLTMNDLEELHDKMQSDFFDSIQNLWCIPIADEYQRTPQPVLTERPETQGGNADTPKQKEPPEGPCSPPDGTGEKGSTKQ